MSRLFSGTPLDRPIVCDVCGKAVADCRCLKLPPKKKLSEQPGGKHARRPATKTYELTPENSTPPQDQVARLQLEKRKGGRTVTVLTGLDHPGNDLVKLCAQLKTTLGTGGAVQARTIEIQGDHRAAIAAGLAATGIKTRVL
jgi:translation initiation factor 1